VGGDQTLRTQVRVIAATNRDLAIMVKEKSFREDLFYRINVVQIQLPPLRDRPEDVLLLAEHFLKRADKERGLKFSAASKKALQGWSWPGNVRELENAVSRAVVCAAAESIEPGDLPPEIMGQGMRAVAPGDWWKKVEEVAGKGGDLLAAGEKLLVERALNEAGGNVKRASEILGVTRAALRTRVDRYGLKGEE
jgi:transcriptional regulator with GAF, ATPase, and Fis domain